MNRPYIEERPTTAAAGLLPSCRNPFFEKDCENPMPTSPIQRIVRNRFPARRFSVVLLAAMLVMTTLPAHAASKEMIELQTQVQQLLDTFWAGAAPGGAKRR